MKKMNSSKKFFLILLFVILFVILSDWDDFILGLTGGA